MSSSSSSGRWMALCSAVVAASLIGSVIPRALAEPSPQDKSTARDAVLAGRQLRAKKDFKGALEQFKVAYALVPSPITAYEVGRAYVDAGLLVEGYEKLVDAATMPPKPGESPEAKKARGEAKQLADAAEPRIPSIAVKRDNLPSNGAAVTVSVDGRAVPVDALAAPLKVNPGAHEIVATVEGAPPKRANVTVDEGDAKSVTVRLPDAPKLAATNDRPKRDRGGDAPRVEPVAGTSTWTYVGFTLAGVGLVVGGVTGVLALSKASTLNGEGCTADHRCPSAASGDISSYNALRYTSFASLAVAVVGVGIGVGSLVLGGAKEQPKQGVTVTPWIGLGSIGVQGVF